MNSRQPAVTAMKLIPIELYQELKCDAAARQDNTPPTSRSIASIREKYLVEDPRNAAKAGAAAAATYPNKPPPAAVNVGAGGSAAGVQIQQPIWTHVDPSKLPEFSQHTSVQKAHEDYVQTLNRADLPEHLHRALIRIARANYLKAMKYNSFHHDAQWL